MSTPCYRIRDWNARYENHKTRNGQIKHTLSYVPLPAKQDNVAYLELVNHPNGAAHFGAWASLLQTAAKCSPRGTLVWGTGQPHTAETLGLVSRLPASVFMEVLPRLVKIGWVEALDTPEERLDSAGDAPEERLDIAQASPEERHRTGQDWTEPDSHSTEPMAREPEDSHSDRESSQGINNFEDFQSRYPEAKRNTRVESGCRAYVGRISDVAGEHERLIAGLNRHLVCDQWQRSLANDGGRFIPAMDKFISDGLYNDHPPEYRPEVSTKRSAIEAALDRTFAKDKHS